MDTALPLCERRENPEWGPWSVKAGVTYALAPASALAQVVPLRLHLDDSRPDNGPLRVLPGTHRLGLLMESDIARLTTEVPRRLHRFGRWRRGHAPAHRPRVVQGGERPVTSRAAHRVRTVAGPWRWLEAAARVIAPWSSVFRPSRNCQGTRSDSGAVKVSRSLTVTAIQEPTPARASRAHSVRSERAENLAGRRAERACSRT